MSSLQMWKTWAPLGKRRFKIAGARTHLVLVLLLKCLCFWWWSTTGHLADQDQTKIQIAVISKKKIFFYTDYRITPTKRKKKNNPRFLKIRAVKFVETNERKVQAGRCGFPVVCGRQPLGIVHCARRALLTSPGRLMRPIVFLSFLERADANARVIT